MLCFPGINFGFSLIFVRVQVHDGVDMKRVVYVTSTLYYVHRIDKSLMTASKSKYGRRRKEAKGWKAGNESNPIAKRGTEAILQMRTALFLLP